jgi:hypothetical protein
MLGKSATLRTCFGFVASTWYRVPVCEFLINAPNINAGQVARTLEGLPIPAIGSGLQREMQYPKGDIRQGCVIV